MRGLSVGDVKSLVARIGAPIVERKTRYGFYYALGGETVVRLYRERPDSRESVYELVSHFMEGTGFSGPEWWVLWLYDRVYFDDQFSICLLHALYSQLGERPEGMWDGYFVEASQKDLGKVIASVVVLAEWDLFLVPSHGEFVVNFEHDRLIWYDRRFPLEADPLPMEQQLVDRFKFERTTRSPGV